MGGLPGAARHGSVRAWRSYQASRRFAKTAGSGSRPPGFGAGFVDGAMAISILEPMARQKHSRAAPPASAGKETAGRRRSGLKALAGTLPKVASRALGRRGFADAGLISDWQKIVGGELAQSCAPLRLTFQQPRERREGTLLLRVEPGIALELQHLAPLLVERINTYFGYRAVARLKFQQGPLPRGKTVDLAREAPALTAEDPLNHQLAGVEDDELRASLRRLAESYRARQRKRRGGNR